MRFSKIKYDGETVELRWHEENGPGDDDHRHVLKSDDTPAPSFTDALDGFKRQIVKLLELPDDYDAGMTVRGVSLSYDDNNRMGVVVTALKELIDTNAPLVLNTPHLPEPDIDDEGPQMSQPLYRAVEKLKREAQRCIDDHREQRDMFEGDEEDGDAEDREPVGAGASLGTRSPAPSPIAVSWRARDGRPSDPPVRRRRPRAVRRPQDARGRDGVAVSGGADLTPALKNVNTRVEDKQ